VLALVLVLARLLLLLVFLLGQFIISIATKAPFSFIVTIYCGHWRQRERAPVR